MTGRDFPVSATCYAETNGRVRPAANLRRGDENSIDVKFRKVAAGNCNRKERGAMMKMKFRNMRCLAITPVSAVTYFAAVLLSCCHAPGIAASQTVVYVHDGLNLAGHRLRGETLAKADLKAGTLKVYVPVCTFPLSARTHVRQYEIRKALYGTSGIKVMADLCNDIVPNGSQQEAFVAGYNSVMDLAITSKLGPEWKKSVDRQVRAELKRNPRGTLQAKDITSETPY